MSKSNLHAIHLGTRDDYEPADLLAVWRERIHQAIAIVDLVQPHVRPRHQAALGAASEILDQTWSDLGEALERAQQVAS